MKLSEYIDGLKQILIEEGDLDCLYASDDEGNGYSYVYNNGTVVYIDNCELGQHVIDKIHTKADIVEYTGTDSDLDNYTKVIIVN